MFAPVHTSAQVPANVEHPVPALQFAVQHTFDGPAAQVVGVAVHVHVLHAPPPLQ